MDKETTELLARVERSNREARLQAQLSRIALRETVAELRRVQRASQSFRESDANALSGNKKPGT